MNEIYATVAGNVVGDPAVRDTRAHGTFTTFRLASNVRRLDTRTGEYTDGGTSFFNVVAFRALGINLANSLHKGQPVLVHGRVRVNQWSNAERSGTTVEIDAQHVGFDMSWGQSSFQKVARPVLNLGDRLSDPAVQEAQHGLADADAMSDAQRMEPDRELLERGPRDEDAPDSDDGPDGPDGTDRQPLQLVGADSAGQNGTGYSGDAATDDYVLAGVGQP